jgi:hypothetical protein
MKSLSFPANASREVFLKRRTETGRKDEATGLKRPVAFISSLLLLFLGEGVSEGGCSTSDLPEGAGTATGF